MIETFDSDSATRSGRSRSKRSVGRLSKSLTKASNSLNVFASMAFITTEEVGTFAFLSDDMSRVPSYLNEIGIGNQVRRHTLRDISRIRSTSNSHMATANFASTCGSNAKRGWSDSIGKSLFIWSLPCCVPFAMWGSLRIALRLLDANVLHAGQLGHPLDPTGDPRTSGCLRREVEQFDRRSAVGLVLDLHCSAVVERSPHVGCLAEQR